jgi:transposase InsO family protein
VTELYAKHVFPHYGIPRKVISDQDPWFTRWFTTTLCEKLGIKQNLSIAYHPQMDGQSERTNQWLEQYLRIFGNYLQSD